jgi:hypothetical protein
MINTMCVNRFLAQPELWIFLSAGWKKPFTYTVLFLQPRSTLNPTLFKLSQQEWLPDLIKTSLLFENFSSDMSYKTSPSSSSEKYFYPQSHIVLSICCRVDLCCDLLLHIVRLHICPDCLKIEGNGKQMMMMVNFRSQSGWRHNDGFAENIFTGIARLGVVGPAPW